MIIREIDINNLTPAPYNPRIQLLPGTERFEKLKNSLEVFDLVQPVVWNEKTGHIVGGHQRVEVMKHLGHKTVPVVVVNLTLEREQSLNITLNNHHVGSDWDQDKLVDLLESLADSPDLDLSLTGFDPQQLQDLCYKPDPDFHLNEEQESDISQHIKAILEIPHDQWDEAEPLLNNLLAQLPLKLTIHKP